MNYVIESEDELQELGARNIENSVGAESEEEADLSSEDGDKFIVADGYLSNDEISDVEENK